MSTYQNRPVTVLRDAKQGDVGFNPAVGHQSLVRHEDEPNKGQTSVAPTGEVTPA